MEKINQAYSGGCVSTGFSSTLRRPRSCGLVHGHRSHQLPQSPLRIDTDKVMPASVFRDLGIYIDFHVSMSSQVKKTVSLCLLRRTTSAANRPPVRSQIRSPVAGDVTRSDAAGSRKYNPRRHPAVSAKAASVGDELCCSAGVFLVKVRANHSTPTSTPLVEGGERIDYKLPVLVYTSVGMR